MSFKVKAIFEYKSGHEDDLDFPIGQIITVDDEEDADWYGGEYVDESGVKHEGIFPRNFVEKCEPTAPPRPTRTRTKKEPEPVPPVEGPAVPNADGGANEPQEQQLLWHAETAAAPPPVSVAMPEPPAANPAEPVAIAASSARLPKPTKASIPASPPAPKATPTKPSGSPSVSDMPIASSFKDRIAAFNKAADPPITPKPGGFGGGFGPKPGSSSFIKKPFVAPPPKGDYFVPANRDVPIAKLYRRDEDVAIKEQEAESQENYKKVGLPEAQGDEEQPKPLRLKEFMALLQKQQADQVAKHAEAAAKKDKPKRPPKKRLEGQEPTGEDAEPCIKSGLERRDTGNTGGKRMEEESLPPRMSASPRCKTCREHEPRDGNEADLSGAGDTTEEQDEDLERDDSDEKLRHATTGSTQDDGEDEEEEDAEVRRKAELRARMARMAGGFGIPGMGAAMFNPLAGLSVALPAKKKKPRAEEPQIEEQTSPTGRAPAVPLMMALPGMSRLKNAEDQPPHEDEDEDKSGSRLDTPHQESIAPGFVSWVDSEGGRGALPPVPAASRPVPSVSPSVVKPREGSESDDELSEEPPPEETESCAIHASPPIVPPSPRSSQIKRRSYMEGTVSSPPTTPTAAASPLVATNKRTSRPPPIPGTAPTSPPPAQTRPPPPPPPTAAPPSSRESTAGAPRLSPARAASYQGANKEEVTEYASDYDTHIASSAPHKAFLKHQRDSSFEGSVRSPLSESPPALPPPIPSAAPPRAVPPPRPSQPLPETRTSTDVPRAAPPPPPRAKEARPVDDASFPSYASPPAAPAPRPPGEGSTFDKSPESRGPPSAPLLPSRTPRLSFDMTRSPGHRRSLDVGRSSMETGYVANDMDLAGQSGWWLQPSSLPPLLQGRKDVLVEMEESTGSSPRGKTGIARDIHVLYQDYSQTIITARFNPRDVSDVQLEQRHQGPPRTLRQDQLEQAYEQFGRAIGEAVMAKKDTVVGDGTPQGLVHELLKPHGDALLPVGTRAYGALVYSNLANASTSQNDEIRAGDIISIRNARFQGKHGAMHAKYSVEIGKPDHVAIVAEWDGTKKKVRAWEQGRESRKVKIESFKLDDLRSGEVKIWRVIPRGWVGWESKEAKY